MKIIHMLYYLLFNKPVLLLLSNCTDVSTLANNVRPYYNSQVLFIDCFFERSNTFISNGGIIVIYNSNLNLTIKSCIFTLCKCSTDGGAIYYSTADINSGCFFSKVCANQCSANKYHFSLLSVKNSISNEIKLEFLTEYKCSDQFSGDRNIWFDYGSHVIQNVNMSDNKSIYNSGLYVQYSSKFVGNYSTFFKTYAQQWTCFAFLSLIDGNVLSFMNFIDNSSPQSYVFEIGSKWFFRYCIFFKNTNSLFSSTNVVIEHSILNHTGSLVSITTSNNNTKLFQQTLPIIHLSTHICFGDLTPIPEKTLPRTYPENINELCNFITVKCLPNTFVLLLKIPFFFGFIILKNV